MKRLPWHKLALVCIGLVLATNARAGTVLDTRQEQRGNWHLALGPVAGAFAYDDALANYRWDTRTAFQSGIAASLYRGRVGVGARFWRTKTTQSSGIPGESQAPHVNLTGTEIVAQAMALSYFGIELWGSAHTGLLHVGYQPDQMTFDSNGLPQPITVNYDPIDEWDYGLGVELRTTIARQAALSLQLERTTFALDTSHRAGQEIVESREHFHSWSLRVQASWLLSFE